MGLSRLENFLRSVRGNIIYVDPNSLDSTDSIENTGTALTRPFKSIQRALIEAARFSYLPGPDNDRFGETTILVYPGDHLIDNRPGWIPDGEGAFRLRNGQISSDFAAFDLRTNFNVTTDNNALYKMNSIHGGVIVPRGTSIVGMDLRKTKIRPKYVPNPRNSNIERSAIFRLTGGCYLSQFSIFDSDINGQSFIDYTGNKYTPNLSHHKLTCFEYADGYNTININDDFQVYSTDRTDLDVYYEKLSLAYGPSAREILPDYPDDVDIETKIDEYRIVGSRGEEVGISSIFSGDGVTANKTITVFLESEVEGLSVDTPIRIDGAVVEGYDGQYIVKNVISPTQIEFETTVIPTGPDGGTGGTLSIVSDTVTSASPYIFNCSLRSVYGMCGLHADGDSVEGFRSIVVAQFTGISLQKDNDAFVKYDPQSGKYLDSEDVPNIYSDSLGRYKPEYENYHIKASNNAFIQCVSIFAIGFAQQFEAASGGDQSITNSNSNFGAKALLSRGFRKDKFIRDDLGYITHIIPAKQNISDTINIEYLGYDAVKTVSVGSTTRLYLYNQTDESSPPEHVINGFRIGAKKDDVLYLPFSSGVYNAPIIMGENYQFAYEKSYKVAKQIDGITNSISSNIISLETTHQLQDGESVRLISDTGELPDKVDSNRVYYAITSGLSANQLKIASSFNDAISNNSVDIYGNESSNIKVVSRVSDKKSGDSGHPIQYDDVEEQWYITAKLPSAFLFVLSVPNSSTLSTGQRTYIQRLVDSRTLEDKLYKIRYVIPKNTDVKSRTPLDGYIIQSSTSIPESDTEVSYQYGLSTVKTLDAENQLRSTRFISNASWDGTSAIITTELPHRLSVGSQIDILNILSAANTSGTYNSGYNGLYTVAEITSSRSFKYTLSSDPGSFLDNTSTRTRALPRFDRKQYDGTYFIYKSQELQEYVHQKQDGIYYLTVLSSSTTPNVDPFTNFKLSQPIKNLYPEIDRDNLNSDPDPTECFALPDPIGQVVVNDPEKSITKESINDILIENSVGFGVTYIDTTGGEIHIISTNIDHGLNPITSLTISNPGSAYGTISGSIQTLYNAELTGGSGEGASAVVKTNTSGSITEVEIMSGGSGYVVGDVLTVTGVATTTGHSPATVTVNSIYNHVGEILQISGTDEDYEEYNTLYRILSVNGSKEIGAESATNVPHSSVSQENLANSNCHLTGGLYINGGGVTGGFQVYYNTLVETGGIETFLKVVLYNTQRPKQLKVGQKIILKTLANGSREFVITGLARYANKDGFTIEAVDNTPNLFFIGISPRTFSYGHYSSFYGNNTEDNENRIVTKYDGVVSTLTSTITNTTTTIGIDSLSTLGLKIGDYLEINNEIVRISRSVSGSSVQVFRGLLGTQSRSHGTGSYVRKIIATPIEFRRNSILRASGHTFEYVGFGPGNYSNSLPERQDRQISEEEEIISQSLKVDGGVTVYTGMNNDGDFYIGNKIINSSTGNESVFDSPIPTLRGDKTNNKFNNIINTEKANATDSIKVEGGPDGTSISEFNGPVIFNNRLTSNSEFGIEGNSIYIQGNETVSRKYTVTGSEPTIIGNVGDVEYYSTPEDGGFSGWIYTKNNAWRKYGPIQNADGAYEGTWNGVFEGEFYGDASGLTGLDSAWKRTSAGIHTSVNVGIGTEQASSTHKLEVNGSTNIKGVLNVGEIIERVTIDSSTELGNPLTPTIQINLGDNNVYYFTRSATKNWRISFRASSSQTLDQFMSVGQTLTVAIMTTQGANAYYSDSTLIDGAPITVFEYGDLEIIEGNPDGIDMYTYVIIKKSNTGSISNKFTVLRSLSQYTQQP